MIAKMYLYFAIKNTRHAIALLAKLQSYQPLERVQECSNKKLREQPLRKSNWESGGSN